MSHNHSWLKKPESRGLLGRGMPHQNSIDSSLGINDYEGFKVLPPRKSCVAFREMRMPQLPREGKKASGALPIRKSILPQPQLKNQVKPRQSMLPASRLAKARVPSQSGQRQTFSRPSLAQPPLHKSTPCDPSRSILKTRNNLDRQFSPFKKVNFGPPACSIDERFEPLDESTIHDVALDVDPVAVVKVDAGTTMFTAPENDSKSASHHLPFRQYAYDMNQYVQKLNATVRDMMDYQNSFFKTELLSIPQIQLDDIPETSENDTPNSCGPGKSIEEPDSTKGDGLKVDTDRSPRVSNERMTTNPTIFNLDSIPMSTQVELAITSAMSGMTHLKENMPLSPVRRSARLKVHGSPSTNFRGVDTKSKLIKKKKSDPTIFIDS